MLSFLLDEHVSPEVAEQVAAKHPEIPAQSLRTWRGGALVGAGDEVLLAAARDEDLTLVTYDQRTVPPLLVRWGAAGLSHAGVVFVDDRTIAPGDIGGLVHALISFWEVRQGWDWTDRIAYLESGEDG